MSLRIAELETLFTANTKPIANAERDIKAVGKRIESKAITQEIDGDAKGAIASMDRVEKDAKRLVSRDTALTINANIDRFDRGIDRAEKRLEYLRSIEATVDVKADIGRTEANLQRIQRQADALRSSRVNMVVDADGTKAEAVFKEIRDQAGDAGLDGGEAAGDGLSDGLVAALASIPIAGAIAGIAYVAARAVRDGFVGGLAIEARQDRLEALTGIQEADAARLARAAGEAYANNFGESIEANVDAARLGLQFDILDGDESNREAQKVISGLQGIADIMGGDVTRTSGAVATLLTSGLAASTDEAFDLIAAGARNGLDKAEDLLDTLIEYPALFKRLGISGPESIGLLNQALAGGARNSDIAADALKEFQILATDGSEKSAEAFRSLGFDAEDMTAKIAAGGEGAREGLDQVLDKLRETEDPVLRNAAAVGLFGTKAEDLGDALFAMDLSTAVDQLDGVAGSAQRMFDTLADNDANRIETARRNIEVAAQGIQGALAAAFSEPIGDFATFVAQNRGPVLQFMVDLANGALDFGDSMVEGLAGSTEALGEFVAGPLADLTKGLAGFVGFFDKESGEGLDELAEGMRGFDDVANEAADTMREDLGGALDRAREKLNDFAEPQLALAYLNDASLRLAGALDEVGVAADGSQYSIQGIDVAALNSTASGQLLEGQLYAMRDALEVEIEAAARAGETEDELKRRRDEGRVALENQLIAMGFTQGQVETLMALYDSVQPSVSTDFYANTADAVWRISDLQARLDRMPGQKRINLVVARPDGTALTDRQLASQFGFGYDGGVVEFMRNGGIRGNMPGLVPMDRVAQVVSPNTFRVVGDRGDVSESYIPHDGSARSMAILLETMRRFGLLPMADGGVLDFPSSTAGGSTSGRSSDQVPVTFVLPAGVTNERSLLRAAAQEYLRLQRRS